MPADQVQPLREAILAFLHASHVDMVDKAQRSAEFARARELAEALPEPARTLMNYVNERDVAQLGPILLPHVGALGGDAALSPAKRSRAAVPGLPAARHRRQRDPGGGIGAAGADARASAASRRDSSRRR